MTTDYRRYGAGGMVSAEVRFVTVVADALHIRDATITCRIILVYNQTQSRNSKLMYWFTYFEVNYIICDPLAICISSILQYKQCKMP
jgi:predicted transglutaminase-like protease